MLFINFMLTMFLLPRLYPIGVLGGGGFVIFEVNAGSAVRESGWIGRGRVEEVHPLIVRRGTVIFGKAANRCGNDETLPPITALCCYPGSLRNTP
jgi:hypothetical protein